MTLLTSYLDAMSTYHKPPFPTGQMERGPSTIHIPSELFKQHPILTPMVFPKLPYILNEISLHKIFVSEKNIK